MQSSVPFLLRMTVTKVSNLSATTKNNKHANRRRTCITHDLPNGIIIKAFLGAIDAFLRKMSKFEPWNTCQNNDTTRFLPS